MKVTVELWEAKGQEVLGSRHPFVLWRPPLILAEAVCFPHELCRPHSLATLERWDAAQGQPDPTVPQSTPKEKIEPETCLCERWAQALEFHSQCHDLLPE